MASIQFSGIAKDFGDTKVVCDFNLEIADGEFVVLVGPSGCGKTTSLRMLAGLEKPTSGRILLNGVDITHVPSKSRELAMVFQSYALYPHMSVEENIGFSLSLKKMPRAEIQRQVAAAAERLEIDHLLARKPRELSGGQRQRVAVARSIVRQPQAFLFDEPLSNLDAKLRHSARIEIRKLQQQLGTTTVYVTHDQIEAMTMADRIVVMEGGRIRQVGTPMQLYMNPNCVFVASFLGAPPTNCIKGEVRHADGDVLFTAPGLSVRLASHVTDGPATLGIRPESLMPRTDNAHHLHLEGVVRFVEALGAETLIDLGLSSKAGSEAVSEVTARLPGHHLLSAGQVLPLSIDRTSLRLFDKSGDVIEGGIAGAPR
ncbi:ABC-type sugar transport system ATPase subunit [Devosia sp. UYZn731]|uniref:ABC transporter ATP-binding protein n=1 Tax=Devosia sp. UYZn731 TaxID=3156345 RepID=UPI0033991CB3